MDREFVAAEVSAGPGRCLFGGGPPRRLQRWLCFTRADERNVPRRALMVALIGWLPLVLLSALRPHLLPGAGLSSMFTDYALIARSLISAPLLIVAEASCSPQLAAMASHFAESGLVSRSDRPRFERAVTSIRRRLNARLPDLVVTALAYATVAAILLGVRVSVPEWQSAASAGPGRLSPAGWWHALVSVPLLLALIYGWLWRLYLWARFLWAMSRLELRLVASHPDRAGGLGFLGYSLRAFALVAIALGALVAGTVANDVFNHERSPQDYVSTVIYLVLIVVTLFATPLLPFTGNLIRTWQHGVLEYGGVADELGHQFENKWLRTKRLARSALAAPDFSAMADLYDSVGKVHEMRVVPLDTRSLILLVIATVLPFAPVAILSLPGDVILHTLTDLLF